MLNQVLHLDSVCFTPSYKPGLQQEVVPQTSSHIATVCECYSNDFKYCMGAILWPNVRSNTNDVVVSLTEKTAT